MRTLIQFLIRQYPFFLFLLFEGLCLYLIQQNNRYHHTQIVNSTNSIVGGVYDISQDVTRYFQLARVNDSLRAENAKLRSEVMPGAVEWDTLGNQTIVLDTQQVYEFIPARVMRTTINQFDNYITLNRGENAGIEVGMGVIGLNGILGKVVGVSKDYAKAMSVLHHDFRVSCQLRKNGVRGVLQWKGMDPHTASMDYVTEPANLAIGDTVVTTAGSTLFPEGVVVGTIQRFELKPGDRFYNITLKLSTDFNRVHTGYVVLDLQKEQRLMLDSLTTAP